MASGKLGNSTAILATQSPPQIVYTVPTGIYTVANVSITNRNSTSVKIRMALSTGTTPSIQEYIEYDVVIPGNSTFERSGLVLNAALNILVYSDTANVGVTVYGIETSTS
jgi:hypothetical protein